MGKEGLTFGQYIKEKRESLGKSLRSVAADIGMAPAYLSDVEKVLSFPFLSFPFLFFLFFPPRQGFSV